LIFFLGVNPLDSVSLWEALLALGVEGASFVNTHESTGAISGATSISGAAEGSFPILVEGASFVNTHESLAEGTGAISGSTSILGAVEAGSISRAAETSILGAAEGSTSISGAAEGSTSILEAGSISRVAAPHWISLAEELRWAERTDAMPVKSLALIVQGAHPRVIILLYCRYA